jgi:hypothetical protein
LRGEQRVGYGRQIEVLADGFADDAELLEIHCGRFLCGKLFRPGLTRRRANALAPLHTGSHPPASAEFRQRVRAFLQSSGVYDRISQHEKNEYSDA